MNVSVRKRARQRIRLMQAELDGRGQADDPPFWFAVWNVRHNVAYALDAYPDELIPYERSLRSARRDVGDHFAGPFPSQQQARTFAVEKLTATRKGSARRDEKGSE
jgi:hypothetical protein